MVATTTTTDTTTYSLQTSDMGSLPTVIFTNNSTGQMHARVFQHGERCLQEVRTLEKNRNITDIHVLNAAIELRLPTL